MPHSPSRGLLYTAPPTPEENRSEGANPEESPVEESEASADAGSASAAADD